MEATFEMTDRQELIGMYSDTYKDANGIRPRYTNFDLMTNEEIEADIKRFCDIANENAIEEAKFADLQVDLFKANVKRYINEYGADNEEVALRWIAEAEDSEFHSIQDIEHLVWSYNILFTDYGRELVKKLEQIVKFV